MRMFKSKFGAGSLIVAVGCLATLGDSAGIVLAQQSAAPAKARAKRARAKNSGTKSSARPKAETDTTTVADRIVLRDDKALLGQVAELSNDGLLTVLARRELVRKTLPKWAATWEVFEKDANAAAIQQRRERMAGWRQERLAQSAPGDRISTWLERELTRSGGAVAPSNLMAIRLDRDDFSAVERRSELAAQALRAAWVLGLANPETTSPATLRDMIAGRGLILANDDPIALDRLLPPFAERANDWLLRRAATEVLNDNNLRFIGFGNNILPEPLPGRPLDPAAAVALVDGTIRDVLGVGRVDSLPLGLGALAGRGRTLLPLPMPGPSLDLATGGRLVEGTIRDVLGAGRVDLLHSKLQAVAANGQVGMILTRIGIATDLASASAESTLFYYNGSNWERAIWRTHSLEVGTVPPIVASMVRSDPQAQAVMNLIDSIGAGFVSPEMNERGLAVGATVGGAVVLARSELTRSLKALAFDVEGKVSATPR
jgi:hypothetical protein